MTFKKNEIETTFFKKNLSITCQKNVYPRFNVALISVECCKWMLHLFISRHRRSNQCFSIRIDAKNVLRTK